MLEKINYNDKNIYIAKALKTNYLFRPTCNITVSYIQIITLINNKNYLAMYEVFGGIFHFIFPTERQMGKVIFHVYGLLIPYFIIRP